MGCPLLVADSWAGVGVLGCSKAMVSLRSRDVSTLTISTRTWKNEPDAATYSSTVPLLLLIES